MTASKHKTLREMRGAKEVVPLFGPFFLIGGCEELPREYVDEYQPPTLRDLLAGFSTDVGESTS